MHPIATRTLDCRKLAGGYNLRGLLAVAAVVLTALWSTDLLACTAPHNLLYEPDSDASADEPLDRPKLSLVKIGRGTGPQGGCGEQYSTSCDDIGRIDVEVSPTADQVGYVLRKESGTLPDGVRVHDEPISLDDGRIYLSWIDEATDDQEKFDFTITVTPINPDGEPGPTSDPLRISHSGSPTGCRTTPGGPSPLVAPWICLVVLGLYRVGERF